MMTGWLYLTYTKSIRNQTIPADLQRKLFDAIHNSQSYCVDVMRSWSNMKSIEHVQLNFCRRIFEDSNYKFYVCDICWSGSKSLKIPKGKYESIYRRRTDNTMAKRQKYTRTNNDQQNIHIKLNWISLLTLDWFLFGENWWLVIN
jgi:hypothetical protein